MLPCPGKCEYEQYSEDTQLVCDLVVRQAAIFAKHKRLSQPLRQLYEGIPQLSALYFNSTIWDVERDMGMSGTSGTGKSFRRPTRSIARLVAIL